VYPSFCDFVFGNGFPVANIIYDQTRPKSQHKNKIPTKIPSKLGILAVKMMAVNENERECFLLP
jgi:hypothetical protein